MYSWRVLILPHLDHSDLYKQFDLSKPWNSPENLKLLEKRPAVFQLHGSTDATGIMTNYLAVVGERTMWPTGKALTYDAIPDGSSTVIQVVENTGSGIRWSEPRDLSFDTMSFGIDTDPVNGISSWLQPPAIVMPDGRVMKLDMAMTADELRSMLIIDDGVAATPNASELEDGRDRSRK